MIVRKECVICCNDLKLIFAREKYPITASPPTNSEEFDIYTDQTFYKCVNCSCIQLGNLVDPILLYDSAHNNTMNTPTWKEHHTLFAKFIGNDNDILEIGGCGHLYNILKSINEQKIEYSCLDICDPIEKIDDVIYLKGNCETFNFPQKTLVLSHTFEHLYNPRNFLSSIQRSNIRSIYISIPDMMKSIDLGVPNFLHNEHTYYIDKYLIEWLFSEYGYVCQKYYEFKNHSLFFYFQKGDVNKQTKLENRRFIAEKIHSDFKNESSRLHNLVIKEKSFIMPAGLFGQFLCYTCPTKNILGFIDNDISKQNKRVYGTTFFVYSLEDALRLTPEYIYLIAGPYTNEIKDQIRLYDQRVEIIVL